MTSNVDVDLSGSEGEYSFLENDAVASRNPDEDDAGGTRMQNDEELQDEYYDSLTPDDLGSGWFNQGLNDLHTNVTLAVGSRYTTSPRPYDSETSPRLPKDHPLRAIAKALHDAADGSLIRVYAYMLTDPLAIDMLIHYGKNNPVRLILYKDEDDYNQRSLRRFFSKFGSLAGNAFQQRIQVQWVMKDTVHCSRYTQMHIKTVITNDICLIGSYNLSCPARCANWENLVALQTTEKDKSDFDSLWTLLSAAQSERKKRKTAPAPAAGNPYTKAKSGG